MLFSPMIYSLPSYLNGHVLESLACPRVMAAPENIKAGFLKEKDVFAEHGVRYVAPLVSLGDAPLVPKQLSRACADVIARPHARGDARARSRPAIRALDAFGAELRATAREMLERCAARRPALRPRARAAVPHGSRASATRSRSICRPTAIRALDAIPADRRGPDRLDVRRRTSPPATSSRRSTSPTSGRPRTAPTPTRSSGRAKFAARMPWVACVVRLSSYECGMDQPTYSPVQQIVERSGTLFFSFQDLDSTKPAGSVKIRVETIAHYCRSTRRHHRERRRPPHGAGLPAPAPSRRGADRGSLTGGYPPAYTREGDAGDPSPAPLPPR